MGKKNAERGKRKDAAGNAAAEGLAAEASGAARGPDSAREAAEASTVKRGNGGLSRREYEALLEPMQVELNRLARWVQHNGQRVLVLFEGRDAAGKGGVIHAIDETLNPRQCRVVALPKPGEAEATQWYFQRYVAHLPSAGEIVLFDRSWYNRAGVEHVMGYCTDAQYALFLRQAPVFEKLLTGDGILLFKYWLTVDQEQQEQRLRERFEDPLKRWKLSPVDLQARAKYEEYGRARDAMLEATHTRHAPWTLVDFNDQRRGRLTVIRHLLDRLPDVDVPPTPIEFLPLDGPPRKERFRVPPKPLRGF